MNRNDILDNYFSLIRQKKFKEAETIIREGIAVWPDDVYFKAMLANTLFRQRRLTESLEITDEILSRDNNAEALAIKAMVLVDMKRVDEAIDLFELSLHLKDNNFYRSQLVQALLKVDKLDLVPEQLNKLIERDPDNTFYRKLNARFLERSGRRDQAIKVLKPDGEEAPSDPFEYSQYLRLRTKSKTANQAMTELEMVLSLPQHRDNPFLHTLLGELKTKAGQLDAAEDSLKQALRLSPDNSYTRQKLGFLMSRKKDYKVVIELLTPLFIANPADIYIRKTLLGAYEKENRNDDALRITKEALVRHPEVKQLHGIIKKIKSRI